MAVTSRHDSLEYLYKQRDVEAAQQHHAEVMAWAGVAVFVGAMAAVSTTLPHPDGTLWVFRTWVEAALGAAFLIALAYTRRQFNARDWACRIVTGYGRALSSVLEGDPGPEDPVQLWSDSGSPTPPHGVPGPARRSLLRRLGRPLTRIGQLVFPARTSGDEGALDNHPEIVGSHVPDTCPGGASMEVLGYALVVVAFAVASVVALSLAPSRVSDITSANAATFRVGTFGTFRAHASGSPVPRLSERGALPAGVTFTDNRNGTATLSGTPAPTSASRYPIVIVAANGVAPNAVQNFSVNVEGGSGPATRARQGHGRLAAPGDAFTNLPSATATRGVALSISVTTTGTPTPRIKESGRLPRGLGFHDNGDGTATVSGVPEPRRLGTFHFRFKAVFGQGATRHVALQPFALSIAA